MKFIRKLLKSKTIDVNAAILAGLALLKAFDIDLNLTPEKVASIMAVANIALRFFTTKALGDK